MRYDRLPKSRSAEASRAGNLASSHSYLGAWSHDSRILPRTLLPSGAQGRDFPAQHHIEQTLPVRLPAPGLHRLGVSGCGVFGYVQRIFSGKTLLEL